MQLPVRPILALFASSLLTLVSAAASGVNSDPSVGELTAVFSTTHNGYQPARLPDGSPKPVSYAFGEGNYDGGTIVDKSLDHVRFPQLIRLLSGPLSRQGFVPGNEAKQLDQLIVVHWGRTTGWDNNYYATSYLGLKEAFTVPATDYQRPQPGLAGARNGSTILNPKLFMQMALLINLQNHQRDEADVRNAKLLGYAEDLRRIADTKTALRQTRLDLVDEIEDDRYYVVLIAYDFQTLLRTKERKVLWVTRFSLRARGNDFDQAVNGMILAASKYFGRSSDRLRHVEIAEGHVTPGELKVIKYEDPKGK